MKDDIIIEIANLQKQFSNGNGVKRIFEGFNLSLYRNQITSIIGPSGCGKTTLLNMLCGIDNQFSGHIHKNIKSLVGYIFQEDALIPWKTVHENVLLGAELLGDKMGSKAAQCERLLSEFGLLDCSDYYPRMLSGGMKQKVSLAQMLINDPELILLDEPFSSQDFFAKIHLENTFFEYTKEKGISAVLVTHDVEEAIALSDRIVVISQKPCRILKDVSLDFRKPGELLLPEQVRQLVSSSNYYSEIYQTLKPELQ